MTNQFRDKAWGFALFCDDVRAEVGGKLSIMGLYQTEMLFPESMRLPTFLPKLVVVIMYYEIRESIQEELTFKITYGDEGAVLTEVPVSRKDILSGQIQNALPESAEDTERVLNVRLPVTFSPFRLEKMGRLRVRAHYSDGKVLKLGSMAMRQIPTADFQAMMGIVPDQ